MKKFLAELGGEKADVLINNAGRMEETKSITESDTREYWSTIETNLKGVYLVTKYYLNTNMGHGGVIINTSSIGSSSLTPGITSYQMPKTALNRFTESVESGM